MELVRFIRGTTEQINATTLTENAFYYFTDAHELSMVMNGELVPLDNSVYWFSSGEGSMLQPYDVNKRIAYDLDTESLYIAYGSQWTKVGRDAALRSGTLYL